MKPAASKTWRGWRANVRSSDPAGGVETPDAREARRDRRADVHSSGPAKPMQTTAPCKAGRDGRADVGKSGAVKLMKIAAAKAAVESAAGETRGDGCGAGVETGRGVNAAGAKRPSAGAAAQTGGRDGNA